RRSRIHRLPALARGPAGHSSGDVRVPGGDGHDAPRRVQAVGAGRADATEPRPDSDRAEARPVDQRVDRHGGPLTARESDVRSGRTALVLAAPPLAFLLVFFVWPVASILALGLAPGGSLDIAGAVQSLAQRTVVEDIVFTVVLATSATALTLVLGLPVAWVFA